MLNFRRYQSAQQMHGTRSYFDYETVAEDYDVFLSFRGDIRNGFVSVLYDYLDRAQIRVFRDKDEIRSGTPIDSLFKGIENSTICIPILSKNYASSKWCLGEVTKMVELDKKIIPIFYDVTDDDLMSLYRDAIRRLPQCRDSKKMMQRWKNALITVTHLKGMSVHRSSYVDFCKNFTTAVLSMLRETRGYDNLASDDYDIFLSYRGPDVRQGLISVLYDYLDKAGFRVFEYVDDLRYGSRDKNIVKALKNSKICIPIFSKNYASSRWCLMEVTNIVELNKNTIPIFYDVTPDDVKLKTPLYRQAIIELSKNHDSEQVKQWEDALKTISRIKGIEVLSESMVDFCKAFTIEVSSILKPRKRYDSKVLVSMSKVFDSAMELLDVKSVDVRYIGINGMGGIGKTTLAKFIFNQLSTSFDHSAFIEDIRESSGRHGLDHLEKQLREKLDPKFIINSNLSRNIKERFHKRKVLIVLDDVDNREQIEKLARDPTWFGMGSRIIITSRNHNVLQDYNIVDEYSRFTMEMETLEFDQAVKLFCIHAFGSNPPSPTFQQLSKEVVSTAGGLPLTLTVLGSRLCNKGKEVWEDVIARSKEVPPEEVMKRLRISYDALESYVKEVFLDIACFFIGEEIPNAYYMWKACNLSPHMSLATLKSMSLVKTTNDNKIWMHDQLRDLGCYIAQEQSSHLAERTRIWSQEEAMSVLMSKENKENVRAIRLVEPCNPYNWKPKHFSSLVNLRYLQLKGDNFMMNFEGLLPNLLWLSWHSFPGEIKNVKLPLTNLVVLDLCSSFIDENWDGWRQIQTAKKLKVLDLTSCQNLTTTPEFCENMPLERLILKACKNLVSLHSSIAGLSHLKHLNLEECSLLGELPNSIRSLDTEMLIAGSGLNLSMS